MGAGTKTMPESAPETRPYSHGLLDKGSVYLENGFGVPLPDRKIVGLQPGESSAMDMLRNSLMGPSMDPGAKALLDRTIRGDFLTPTANPSWQSWVDSARNETERMLAPQLDKIASSFAGSGASTGSAYANALARARLGATQNFTNTMSNMGQNLYNFERGNQMGAIPLINQGQQLTAQNLMQLFGLEGTQRNLLQQAEDEKVNVYNRGIQEKTLPMQLLAQALGSTNTGFAQYGPGGGAQDAALGIQGAGALAKLLPEIMSAIKYFA
jgi:hypothetical protein